MQNYAKDMFDLDLEVTTLRQDKAAERADDTALTCEGQCPDGN